ncbi:MAG: GIY-YIG nuclease family protein [Limnohabitans sp.]|nr:GIY-YIG nuclease family protein [Limnohabitans sp.]
MEEIGCYIIYSEKLGKYYIGVSQENLKQRITNHNSSFYGKDKFTSVADDWELKLFIKTENFAHAIRIERKLKSMKSKVYIENLMKYPELVEKIYNQTN